MGIDGGLDVKPLVLPPSRKTLANIGSKVRHSLAIARPGIRERDAASIPLHSVRLADGEAKRQIKSSTDNDYCEASREIAVAQD
jgi:hypothetical protein